MMHSINDLTTFCRKTTGDVPAKLVGASTTVPPADTNNEQGGRLVTERKMVSDLYVFDMDTFNWEMIPISPDDDVPRPRYFHSADTWNNHLIIFGGMSNQPDSDNLEELCVLNDVRFFDIATCRWLPAPQPSAPVTDLLPRARYAHLSSVTADRLFIIGGQDFNNTWLDDVCVFDLVTRSWVLRRDYPRHCGTYRSVAVSSHTVVRFPQDEVRTAQAAATLGPPGQRFGSDRTANPNTEFTPSESLIHQPYSASPSEEHPSDIFLYSNYNFTDVKRELEVFSPLPEQDFIIEDKSTAMAGSTCPPGLRFPTGALLGTHLIIAGTYLAQSYQSFSIWVLDLTTMTWSRIDPGKAVETGSWFRGSLYADANKFVIFGNRNGNLVDDYNRRLLSWDHVSVVDLESFGVYGPPKLKLDLTMQELGLAALEERTAADFEVVCDDGRRIPCSRKILEERWPWFLEQRKDFASNVNRALSLLPPSPGHLPLPDVPGNTSSEDPRVDPRLISRALELAEPYPIVLALLQYFYTTALVTPLQHAPAVLSQLLLLSTNYGLDHLESLIKHAMHKALSNSTSVGVYEVATLCNCRSLQIRALKTVMQYTQKRPSRRSNDKDSKPPGSSSGPPNGSGGGGPSPNDQQLSRPRGTSDARWRTMGSGSAQGSDVNSGYNTASGLPFVTVKQASTPRPSTSDSKNQSPANLNYLADLMGVPSTEELQNLVETHSRTPSVSTIHNLSDSPTVKQPANLIFPIAEDRASEDQTAPVPMSVVAIEEESPRDVDTPVPRPMPNATEDQSKEDQIMPLPNLRPRKSQRRNRTVSIVSIHTEEEMHELVDYFSDFASSDTSSIAKSSVVSLGERDDMFTGELSPSIITASPELAYLNRSNRNSFSPSVAPSLAPSLSASILTVTDSDHSDGLSDKHESSLSIASAYNRSRPPRIFTDSMQSIPSSLTSSTSNSSLSNSRYTSPATPVTTSLELSSPTDLSIIDERLVYDHDVGLDSDNLDPFSSTHSSFFAQDHPVKKWPQQRSNVNWTPLTAETPTTQISISNSPSTPSLTNVSTTTSSTVVAEPISPPMSPPMSPGTPSGGTFGRLLGRKKDDGHAKEKEKKRREQEKIKAREDEKKNKERKAKETPDERKARIEQLRKERVMRALSAEPSMMGGMMALA
ncbi:hypothetical protein C0991_004270 [Blastosporella zonata]|nr:hypothetical protein C0991_004270 [Blastosporella zonata]